MREELKKALEREKVIADDAENMMADFRRNFVVIRGGKELKDEFMLLRKAVHTYGENSPLVEEARKRLIKKIDELTERGDIKPY